MTKTKEARKRAAARPDKEKTRKITVPYGARVLILKDGEPITDETMEYFQPLLEPIIAQRVRNEIDKWLELQKNGQQTPMSPAEVAEKVMGQLRGLPFDVQTKVVGHTLQRLKLDRQQYLDGVEKQEASLTSSRRNAQRHVYEFENVLNGSFTIL